jgi:hypothetical protein
MTVGWFAKEYILSLLISLFPMIQMANEKALKKKKTLMLNDICNIIARMNFLRVSYVSDMDINCLIQFFQQPNKMVVSITPVSQV